MYFNTSTNVVNVYNGSAWVAAYASLSGALTVSNNLSDLANAGTARTNLGLGSAATTASTAYAPAAGSSNIVTTGALNSGSITSGFGAIDNGASNITTTGVGTFASLDISGDIDVDGTTNLDIVDIDGAVNMATTALVTGVLTTTAATVFNGGFAANAASTITETGNNNTLTLSSTDADANAGPNLLLFRNSGSAADSDRLATITYRGKNDAAQNVDYIVYDSFISDASDGSEDASLDIRTILAGSEASRIALNPPETVINESSNDLDFRVESNGNANMLFVDGGNNKVAIGTATATATLTVAGSVKPTTYQETYAAKSAASTVTCDLATAQHFSVTVSANTTFAFTNPPSSGTSYSFTLIVTQHSTAVTLTWPNTVDWAGGSAPAVAGNNEVQAYGFVTRDGGTTYYGFLGGTAIA